MIGSCILNELVSRVIAVVRDSSKSRPHPNIAAIARRILIISFTLGTEGGNTIRAGSREDLQNGRASGADRFSAICACPTEAPADICGAVKLFVKVAGIRSDAF
jgi:hypothetical protein